MEQGYEYVQKFVTHSSEWFAVWLSSMKRNISYISGSSKWAYVNSMAYCGFCILLGKVGCINLNEIRNFIAWFLVFVHIIS